MTHGLADICWAGVSVHELWAYAMPTQAPACASCVGAAARNGQRQQRQQTTTAWLPCRAAYLQPVWVQLFLCPANAQPAHSYPCRPQALHSVTGHDAMYQQPRDHSHAVGGL